MAQRGILEPPPSTHTIRIPVQRRLAPTNQTSPAPLTTESRRLGPWWRPIGLLLAGHMGTNVVTTLVLCALALWRGSIDWYVAEMVGGAIFLRLVYYLNRGPKPVLASYLVRKRLRRVIEDETKLTVSLTALCFVLSWPIGILDIAVFAAVNLLLQIGTLVAGRRILSHLAVESKENARPRDKKVIIIGTGPRAKHVADVIIRSPELEATAIGFFDYCKTSLWSYRDIPLLGHPDDAHDLIAGNQVDAIIFAVEPEDLSLTQRLFGLAEEMGVTVLLMNDIYAPGLFRPRPGYINGTPALVYRAVPENQFSLAAKAVIDRVGAAVGLATLAPLMALVALAIKIDSRGPVFFRQVRSGLNNRPFKLFKFRTMVCDAEQRKAELENRNEMSGPVFKIKNDPRVTKVGRFLRKTSIDELPQLINVLLGDMSLVGPRPPLPKEVARYEPWQRRKLSVKPGVTCIWQVSGRNNIDFEDWMRLDLEYIDNWSLALDARLLAQTLPAVIRGSGAS